MGEKSTRQLEHCSDSSGVPVYSCGAVVGSLVGVAVGGDSGGAVDLLVLVGVGEGDDTGAHAWTLALGLVAGIVDIRVGQEARHNQRRMWSRLHCPSIVRVVQSLAE